MPSVVIGILGEEMIVGDLPMSKASASMGELIRRFAALGIERITIARDGHARRAEDLCRKFGQLEKTLTRRRAERGRRSARVGEHPRRPRHADRAARPRSPPTAATIRRMYAEAVSVASMVWESARSRHAARIRRPPQSMVDGLAQAVMHNRSALMALTALKDTTTTRSRTW